MTDRNHSLRLLFVAALVLSAVNAPAAFGASVMVTHSPASPGYAADDRLVFRGDPGEANDVTVDHAKDGTYTIEDRGATISVGAGCASLDPHRVTCATKNVLGTFALGDRDDRIGITLAPGTPRAAYSVYDTIFAGTGNDTVELTAAHGQSRAGAGSDFVDKGNFQGSYSVQGDAGDDVITGSADDDILEGGRGRDRLVGGDGDDLLAGGRDDDTLAGGAGADFLLGSDLDAFNFGMSQPPDRDVLDGDSGADLLAGGPGRDLLHGGAQLDTLLYALELGTLREHPARVAVTFDGRFNDGPRGERDNVARPDVESAISVGGGNLSVASTVALRGGAYSLTGGRSTRATIIRLSRLGTRDAQAGTFYGSSFTVHPQPLQGAPTEIRLAGGDFRGCGTSALSAPAGSLFAGAARKGRGLWGRGKGRFRTRGRHAAATVRGTKWLTTDRCDGTEVRVVEGEVAVRDFGLGRTVLVSAGESYLARAR